MALSADHGSSNVMCSRRRWFAARLSACKLMPVDAASEIIATNLSPFWKLSLSFMLTSFSGIPGQRRTYSTLLQTQERESEKDTQHIGIYLNSKMGSKQGHGPRALSANALPATLSTTTYLTHGRQQAETARKNTLAGVWLRVQGCFRPHHKCAANKCAPVLAVHLVADTACHLSHAITSPTQFCKVVNGIRGQLKQRQRLQQQQLDLSQPRVADVLGLNCHRKNSHVRIIGMVLIQVHHNRMLQSRYCSCRQQFAH